MRSPLSCLRRQVGFTLIELTVAMTILVLMTAILYGAFYLGHRATEKAQARFEESQRLRSVGDFLGGYIRSAYPYRFSPRNSVVFFNGEEHHLSMVSAVSMGMGARGMSKVTISWEGQSEDGGLLVLEEETPVRQEVPVEGAGHRNRMVLWEGVESLQIEYLDSGSAEERWLERWDGAEKRTLPRAVRIGFQGGRGERLHWVFPIMVSALNFDRFDERENAVGGRS